MLMRSRSGALIKVDDESLRDGYAAQGFTEVEPKAKPKPKPKTKRKPKKTE